MTRRYRVTEDGLAPMGRTILCLLPTALILLAIVGLIVYGLISMIVTRESAAFDILF